MLGLGLGLGLLLGLGVGFGFRFGLGFGLWLGFGFGGSVEPWCREGVQLLARRRAVGVELAPAAFQRLKLSGLEQLLAWPGGGVRLMRVGVGLGRG